MPWPLPNNLSGPGPTGPQIETMIRSSRPHGSATSWSRSVSMAALAGAMVLLLTTGQDAPPWRQVLPLGLLVAATAWTWLAARRARRIQQLLGQAVQAVQTRQWSAAAESLDRLLCRPMVSLESRTYAMMALAELASHAGLHDQAIEACDEVLVGPADRRSQQFAMVEKALSLLASERLTDANSLMDGFRTMEFIEPMGTMAAVAGLYRQIRTGRFGEAAASADSLAPRARQALHQQAAYAYGLLALALERAGDVARAQRFYDCATRLAGPAELAERFGELAGLERRLTPARSPL